MREEFLRILYHPHHISTHHAPMSKSSRASKFSTFKALDGHEEMIAEEEIVLLMIVRVKIIEEVIAEEKIGEERNAEEKSSEEVIVEERTVEIILMKKEGMSTNF